MNEIKADTAFKRLELPGTRIQDELVLFDHNSGKYFATGPVGADVWDLLTERRTLAELCERLLADYTIDSATCEREVRQFLAEMLAAGVIVPEP